MSACPCGCGKVVADGNTYAHRTCAVRTGGKGQPISLSGHKHYLTTGTKDSWWIGLPREALNAEALRRFPGSQTEHEHGPIMRNWPNQDVA